MQSPFVSCYVYTLSDHLRQHATDFKSLVDINILAVVLFQNTLLTMQDLEILRLQTITESKKLDYLYQKMVLLGGEEYTRFLNSLQDPYASQHDGHKQLYEKLSISQQEIHQYQTTESSLEADYSTSKLFIMHS